jgi:hypothetical protein
VTNAAIGAPTEGKGGAHRAAGVNEWFPESPALGRRRTIEGAFLRSVKGGFRFRRRRRIENFFPLDQATAGVLRGWARPVG